MYVFLYSFITGDQRIINADHGGVGVPFQPSYAGGNVGHSPWISGTKDQFIRGKTNRTRTLHATSYSQIIFFSIS